ncbi:mRNA-capping enzyme subunit beta [Nosema granulosis]|uniref:mRNA-capping enzyme subunit beta n=1 Tax=Nosema granulosis TaxID=83296 RepID=A0A9P6H0E0_9MICR|nr:mRNA-capping enzyme subunit beta [Nosema granulosis]
MEFLNSKRNTTTDVWEIIKSELAGTSSVKYEVEARLGRIHSKDTDSRLHLNSLTPVIFRKLPRKYVFVPGVDKWDIKPMQKGLESFPMETMQDCFKYLSDGNRIRYVNNRLIFCEKKRKIKVLDIYFPEMKYDVRISVMTEEKQMGRMSNSKVNFVRHRDRTSYNDGVFNYDFTVVTNEDTVTYEVEIEVDDPNYSIERFIRRFTELNVQKRM